MQRLDLHRSELMNELKTCPAGLLQRFIACLSSEEWSKLIELSQIGHHVLGQPHGPHTKDVDRLEGKSMSVSGFRRPVCSAS